jgi:hypothetical protein
MSDRKDAELYINDDYVGDVVVQGTEDSWCHGNFYPKPEFTKFATIFGQWSIVMHADSEDEQLSDAASEELRQMEVQIDQLRAKLLLIESGKWVMCSQLNIDGELIEWKPS